MNLDPHQLREVAVQAHCDPRTVRRFLEGQPVRPALKTRIEKALKQLKIAA